MRSLLNLSGVGVENEREGWGNEDGWWRWQLNGNSDEDMEKNCRPVLVPASPRTIGIKRRATTNKHITATDDVTKLANSFCQCK